MALRGKHILRAPSFWIVLFFAVRLIGITNPPLEGGHSWRQVTGLMVARNFLEVDANILLPRVDTNGGKDQIIGMEFPLLNYLHYLLSLLFGYTHWYGRLINLCITSFGIFHFSRLISKVFNERTGLYTALALIFSIFFSYSRKMMPDTFSVAFALMTLHFAYQYLKEKKRAALGYFMFCALIALLSKVTSGLVLSALLLFSFDRKLDRRKWLKLCGGFILILVPVYYWYFVWNPELATEYGRWYNQGMSWKEGWQEISNNLSATAKRFYFYAFYAFSGCLLTIWAVVCAIRERHKPLLGLMLIYSIFGLLYMVKSGFFFHHHNYYVIPFTPFLALLVAYGLTKIKKSWLSISLICVLGLESVANQQHDFFIKEEVKYKMQLEALMDGISTKDEKIVVLGAGNPQLIYLSHRKGWLRSEAQLHDKADTDRLRKAGATFLVIDKNAGESVDWAGKLILDGQDFRIYRF